MAPTRRKKPEKQPKRPSVAKRGKAAAASVPQEPVGEEKAQQAVMAAAEDSVVTEAVVDLADGALYSSSPLTTEDASLQEDRLEALEAAASKGAPAKAGRAAKSSIGEANGQPFPSVRRTAPDTLLPQNAVSAVMGTVVQNLTTHPAGAAVPNGDDAAPQGADLAADQSPADAGTPAEGSASAPEPPAKGEASAVKSDAGGVAGDRAEAERVGGPAEAAHVGGPAEISDEERAAFYAAVPKERPNDTATKSSSKRKGKVGAVKGKGASNPRAGEAVVAMGQKAKNAAQAARNRKVSVGFVIKIVLLVILVAAVALAVVAVVAFNQVRNGGNDAQDIQGTWYLDGTNVAVQITPDEIVLTSDVAYDYQLDVADKTIQLEFGNLEGGGRYLFSLDRSQLMIVDGEVNSAEAWLEDFGWTIRALLVQLRGGEYPLPTMEDATYLNRFPAPGGAVTDATAAAAAEKNLLSAANGADNGANG